MGSGSRAHAGRGQPPPASSCWLEVAALRGGLHSLAPAPSGRPPSKPPSPTRATLTKGCPLTRPTSTGRGVAGSSARRSAASGSCGGGGREGVSRGGGAGLCPRRPRPPARSLTSHCHPPKPSHSAPPTSDTPSAAAKSLAVPAGSTARPTPGGAPQSSSAATTSLTVPSPPGRAWGWGRRHGCGGAREQAAGYSMSRPSTPSRPRPRPPAGARTRGNERERAPPAPVVQAQALCHKRRRVAGVKGAANRDLGVGGPGEGRRVGASPRTIWPPLGR
jgi:hypothetical protein